MAQKTMACFKLTLLVLGLIATMVTVSEGAADSALSRLSKLRTKMSPELSGSWPSGKRSILMAADSALLGELSKLRTRMSHEPSLGRRPSEKRSFLTAVDSALLGGLSKRRKGISQMALGRRPSEKRSHASVAALLSLRSRITPMLRLTLYRKGLDYLWAVEMKEEDLADGFWTRADRETRYLNGLGSHGAVENEDDDLADGFGTQAGRRERLYRDGLAALLRPRKWR